jgi:2-polyprenyl-6-methoxyphenol hydroxylase-like FAD-dependent oxidoreductase
VALNIVRDAPATRALDDRECVEIVRRAIGTSDVPIRLRDGKTWSASSQVADRFASGRVFLAGDAAHVITPYGGLGLNCGLPDVHNLAWKLVRGGRAQGSLRHTSSSAGLSLNRRRARISRTSPVLSAEARAQHVTGAHGAPSCRAGA